MKEIIGIKSINIIRMVDPENEYLQKQN